MDWTRIANWLLKRLGLWAVAGVVMLGLVVWLLAHRAAAPGAPVKVLWGLVEYTKRGGAMMVPKPGPSREEPFARVEIKPGVILATHYPTGELFAVDPVSGRLSLVSARLHEASDVVVRPNGKAIILGRDGGFIIEVDPKTGRHGRMLWLGQLWQEPGAFSAERMRTNAMTLESANTVLVAGGTHIARVDLESEEAEIVAELDSIKMPGAIAFYGQDRVIVSDATDGGKLVEKNLVTKEERILSSDVKFAYAILVESSGSLLVGASREGKGVLLRLQRDGSTSVLAMGPFVTIAGLAKEPDGSIIVADNGEGAPGNGFIARVEAETGAVRILVNAPTSGWRFLNGRGVAVIPAR